MVTSNMSKKAICKILMFGRKLKVDAKRWNAEELTRFSKAAKRGRTALEVINCDCLSESSKTGICENREENVIFL